MKLFRNAYSAARAQETQSWQPEILEDQERVFSPEEMEAILALFRPAQNQDAPEEKKSARLASRAMAWSPADLSLDAQAVAQEPASFDEPVRYNAVSSQAAGSRAAESDRDPVAEAEEEARAILEQAREQANQILMDGQTTADELVADARVEISSLKDAAYRKGIEDAQNEARSYLTAAQTMLAEIDTWKNQLCEQSEPLVIEIIKDIARKMFGEGVALDDKALQQNLNRVLTNVKSLGDLNIYLHPMDAATLNSAWREMSASITGTTIRIFPAESITRGGCYVQGQMGAIDARVETQLQTVLDSFGSISAEARPA